MPGANRLYIGASKRSAHAGSSGVVLGPNLLTNPNGAYASAPWTIEQLTETTGQTDPLGGSTASLLTDNVTNAVHRFYQAPAGGIVNGQKYLITFYYKPGTYPNGMSWITDTTLAGVSVTSAGVASNLGSSTATNITSTSVANGFFKVTFNFVGSGTTFFIMEFNTASNQSYAGSAQTSTFWGCSIQTST